MALAETKESTSLQVGVIFLIYNQGNILLEQRLNEDGNFGPFVIPGGKQEVGETPDQTMLREIREEMGVEVDEFTLLDGISHKSLNNQDYFFYIYLVDGYRGELTNVEGYRCKHTWIPLYQAKEVLTRDLSREIIDKTTQYLI